MKKVSIEKLRHEYGNVPLDAKEIHHDPIEQFKQWLSEAITSKVMEPNGMVLSTLPQIGRPSSRVVLLKGVSKKGFCFYTNTTSRKANQIAAHPHVSLTFWWKEVYRQVHVDGLIQEGSRAEALRYFKSRPKGAQLAALASHQSAPLACREELIEVFERLKKKYQGKQIPCPKDWGGFWVLPSRMEFWQGRKNRLHDRFLYVLAEGEWITTRLSP